MAGQDSEEARQAAEAHARWMAAAWPPPPSSEAPQPAPGVYGNYPPPPVSGSHSPAAYGPPATSTYSPWWKRVLATLLDWVVLSVPSGILSAIAGASVLKTDPVTGEVAFHMTAAYVTVLLISFVGTLAYYVLMEGGPGGATVGKMALNIQVRDESTMGPLGYGKALGRRLMALLFWWLLVIPGLLDSLAPLWDDRARAAEPAVRRGRRRVAELR